MLLLSLVFGALAVRGDPERLFWSTNKDEEDGVTGIGETSGSKNGQVVMRVCDIMACPIQVTQFENHEAVGTTEFTPNVTLEINWNANYFSCRITSIRVSGVLKNPDLCASGNWDYVIDPVTYYDGDQIKNEQDVILGGKDGYWSLAYWKFLRQSYCDIEYGIFMERKNLHSCEAFKGKLMLGGKESSGFGNNVFDYENQTIFQFTFGPWFAATFPEIANGYVDWGSHGSGKDRSILGTIGANKMNLMVGVAGAGFIAAVGVIALKKKNEYAILEQEPLHV